MKPPKVFLFPHRQQTARQSPSSQPVGLGQIGLRCLALTSGLLCCQLGCSKADIRWAVTTVRTAPAETASGSKTDRAWNCSGPKSAAQNVNKQVKCHHFNVSEASAALHSALRHKMGLNLAAAAFLPLHLWEQVALVFLEEALCRNFSTSAAANPTGSIPWSYALLKTKADFWFFICPWSVKVLLRVQWHMIQLHTRLCTKFQHQHVTSCVNFEAEHLCFLFVGLHWPVQSAVPLNKQHHHLSFLFVTDHAHFFRIIPAHSYRKLIQRASTEAR